MVAIDPVAAGAIGPRDLDGEDFISLGTKDPLRLALDHACVRDGVRRRLNIETPIAASAIALVAAGIAVVDAISALASPWREIVIVSFRPAIPIEISIYRSRQAAHSEAAKLLVDALKADIARLLANFQTEGREG